MKPWKLVLIALVPRRGMEGCTAFPVLHFNFSGQLIALIHTERLLGRGCSPQRSIVKSTIVVAPGNREYLADLDEEVIK